MIGTVRLIQVKKIYIEINKKWSPLAKHVEKPKICVQGFARPMLKLPRMQRLLINMKHPHVNTF